jgi:hypothetical protein
VNLEFAIDQQEYLRDRQLMISWQLAKSEILICKIFKKGENYWDYQFWGIFIKENLKIVFMFY